MSIDYRTRKHGQPTPCQLSRRRAMRASAGLAMLGALAARTHAAGPLGPAAKAAFAVVLFIPYDVDDLSFSEAAYRGCLALQRDGYRIDVVSNADQMNQKQMLASIDRYHAAGVRGFILAGAELSAATAAAAARYPRAFFATVSGTARGPNIVDYCLDCRPLGGALAGAVAARESKTKIVGFVGGVEAVDGGEANRFRQAVLDAQPGATVLIDWTGDWSARKLAAQLTERQIRLGADIVVADANDAVIAAASTHRQVRAIGWMVDASRRYRNVVASVVVDTGVIYRRFVDAAAAGRFAGGDYVVTESDNVWQIVWPRR
ncbi:BMP family ABC transporter substrate-binding protein [Paraburkholderia rhizosphaerae]|uniref:Basic membrane lipoprotein Med (Substrate-binding protein (PBP1-ABC) superfamily) n=1 Tax=Paraburkholderia rhizosphaerae TaxID=480658 RepID=A0A4V3HE01_9BURK|nr:BMP family ABC transporter substrate-binding protein [Paraburkholderia rhizosphaerae]TDY43225.1 basic membrane lipoprotein Med (substrate-binding protein (PBP1-ABC) superfamily) [Paraburkholderia rhizosphaerae]